MTVGVLQRAGWSRRVALIAAVTALMLTLFFGLRTYWSLSLLRSANELGAPMTSTIRGWMTLDYVAGIYRIPSATLMERLQLPPDTSLATSLKSVAARARVSPSSYVQQVQRAVADLGAHSSASQPEQQTWLGRISDEILTLLLVYGYPALVVTLVLGSMGLPLPDGALTAFAGSLVAQGRLNWVITSTLVIAASLAGDAIAYAIGRLLDRGTVARHVRWMGYTPARRSRVEALFERWGALTVFITRTFMSYLSSVASLVAGVSGFSLSKFLAVSLVGRIVWTAAYLGIGYFVGANLEAATSFLTNLSMLMLSIVFLAGAVVVATGGAPHPLEA
jgi:membrane-associated protein